MRVALLVLVGCAAVDLLMCGVLLAFVWVEHRRLRREAALAGQPISSAAGPFGCLAVSGLLGLVVLYGAGWFLLNV